MADKKKDDKKAKDEAEKPEAEKDEGKKGAAAEGAEGEAPVEGGKKKLPMKIIIIGAVGAVVLIGIIVAVLLFTGILGGKKEEAPVAGAAAEAKDDVLAGPKKAESAEKKKEGATFYDLGEMVVNLNTDGKRQTFLKLVVQLELENVADKPVIDNLKPRIVDNFQTYLRELRVDDLRGSAGLYRLREELLFRVSEAVHPVKINDVLFQQMLVQ